MNILRSWAEGIKCYELVMVMVYKKKLDRELKALDSTNNQGLLMT